MHPGNTSTFFALPATLSDAGVVSEGRVVHDHGTADWMDAALQKPVQFAAKRALDVVVSAIALLVLSPFLLAIGLAIRFESKGPVLFHQLRWGKCGEMIRIYKFRSMRADLCDVSGVAQTTANDPRVTRVGAFLRKTNLDELPQLINILLGDMSLVGPRCHVPGMLAAGRPYEQLVSEYHLRHLVRPGLTGLAQVKGYRGPTDREDLARGRIAQDLEYVRDFNIMMDIKILVQTFVREIRGGTGF